MSNTFTRDDYNSYVEDVKMGLGWVEVDHLSNAGHHVLNYLLTDVAEGKAEVFKADMEITLDEETYTRNADGEFTVARWYNF